MASEKNNITHETHNLFHIATHDILQYDFARKVTFEWKQKQKQKQITNNKNKNGIPKLQRNVIWTTYPNIALTF